MQCRICNTTTEKIFSAQVLGKYDVAYYECPECRFIQTEAPHWLEEAYSSAITRLDIGLLQRNVAFAGIVSTMIACFFNRKGKFLDFAGGYGVFTRLMRDRGFDYHHQDKFCENIFARNFDLVDMNDNSVFEMITAFELFEHLPEPIATIDEMFSYSDNILFSTVLQPETVRRPEDWNYIAPEIGQHIALYHRKTLEYIAAKKGLFLCTNGRNFHLFSKKKISPWLFRLLSDHKVASFVSSIGLGGNGTLLERDYEYLRQRMTAEK